MKTGAEFDGLAVNRAVSARDTMVSVGAEEEYFRLGRRALELITWSQQLCGKPHYPEILDLPCGHGRVLRWLRAQYGYAKITACDLERDGVDFCAEQFGATGVYSQRDLRALSFATQFDLVWCGSLLTHLAPEAAAVALEGLIRWTKEDGVIVFTVQGRFFGTLLARDQNAFADNVDTGALLKSFQREGGGFQPYYENASGEYGLALNSPEGLMRRLQRYPGVIVRAYLEQAWGVQDVVILYKKAGYFEPFFGVNG